MNGYWLIILLLFLLALALPCRRREKSWLAFLC